jgi:hypothetical protein
VPCGELDDQHLLGEHRELHGLWVILTQGKRGYANHPETRRWRGRLGAIYRRHEEEVAELVRRGMLGHKSPLDAALVGTDSWEPPPATEADLARDRRDLVEHTPGWRRRG